MEAAALGKEATVATATGTVAFQFQKDAWWKSLRFFQKSPSTTLQIPSIGGNAPKQVSLSLGQTTSILDKRLPRSMMESLRNGLQWKRPYFRRQDFKSFQREAASPITSCISCHIGNIKKRSIIVQLDCSLRKHIYRHFLHLTTCPSRLS